MKILEIIELRASEDNLRLVEEYLSTWKNQVSENLKEGSMVITYKHLHLSNDFSIHLVSESKEDPTGFPSLCSELESSLKKFGLVFHSVWIEQSNSTKDGLQKGEQNDSQ